MLFRNLGSWQASIACLVSFCTITFSANESSLAQLPTISLRSISDVYFTPGKDYEVSIRSGTDIDEVTRLHFSHPGIRSKVKDGQPKPFSTDSQTQYGQFSVTVDGDVPLGQHHVRAEGRFGLSNPRSIMVVPDLQRSPQIGHDEFSATSLAEGRWVAGKVLAKMKDVYRFTPTPGRPVRIQVFGQATDSRLVSLMTVWTKSRSFYERAVGSLSRDPSIVYTPTNSEPVFIAISDALYRGGDEYSYGLLVRDLKSDDFPWNDRNLPVSSITVDKSLLAKAPRGDNEDVTEPTKSFAPPFTISGEFVRGETPSAKGIRCTLKKGQAITVDVVSDRIGEPTDARLLVERSTSKDGVESWSRVATAEDGFNITDGVVRIATLDPILRWNVPEDGLYRIRVVDLDNGRSLGERKRYHLSVSDTSDDWRLLAYCNYPHKDVNAFRPRGIQLLKGGAVTVRVFAIRSGTPYPIRINAVNLPKGVHSQPAWISTTQNHAVLTLSADDSAESVVFPLAIEGESTVANAVQKRIARMATYVWESDGQVPLPRLRLVDQLVAKIATSDSAPISIDFKPREIIEVKKGAKHKLITSLKRGDGGNQQIRIKARDLPKGIRVPDLVIPGDKSEGEWTIDVQANTAEGVYSFWGQGEIRVKRPRNPESLDRAKSHLEHLKTLRADPEQADQYANLDPEIKKAEDEVKRLTESTKPTDRTIYVPSKTITVKVVP